jgi:hypothetical protein
MREIPVTWDMHVRFESKLLPGPGDCWAWSGGHFKQTGYAMFSVRCADGKWRPTVAHRIAWRLYRGEFDLALDLDHLCRNRACVNPWHTEPVTRRVNTLRGDGPAAVAARMTECAQGHAFTEENTIVRPNGKRECRTCARARDRERNKTDARREHYRAAYRRRKAAPAS